MKAAVLLILATVGSWAQVPPPVLNCNEPNDTRNGLFPYCELRETNVPFTGALAVTTGGSGNVLVQPWDGADVLVREEIRTWAETTGLAAVVASMVTLDTTGGDLTGSGPAQHDTQNWSLSLEIYVPRKVGLSAMTLNGNVTVKNLEGQPGIALTALNGDVSASGTTGPLTLTDTNGNISASGVSGPIQFKGVNGKVSLTGISSDVEGSLVNGSVLVGAGGWTGQSIQVQNVNGSIELDVPSDCAAHVELTTHLGNITVNVPAPAVKRVGLGRSLSFDIGGGGSLIRASVVVGSIQLKRLD